MQQRGRKSAGALALNTVQAVQRPDAPYDLTDEQVEEWWRVVNAMDASWFKPYQWADLAQRCKHVVAARRVSQLIRACELEEPLDLTRYDKLLAMQERESRTIMALSRSLRMSPQSEYLKTKPRGTGVQIERPWD